MAIQECRQVMAAEDERLAAGGIPNGSNPHGTRRLFVLANQRLTVGTHLVGIQATGSGCQSAKAQD
jgi:hypothetical protein